MKQVIGTMNAPQAIGTYSQAIKAGNIIYFSGQIALLPETMELVSTEFDAQAQQVFVNLQHLVKAAGGTLDQIIKLTIYLTDIKNFSIVNKVMADFFQEPYPARSMVEVKGLPKNAIIEVDAIMMVSE